jgi:uncharacterized protein (DUF1778 family)
MDEHKEAVRQRSERVEARVTLEQKKLIELAAASKARG